MSDNSYEAPELTDTQISEPVTFQRIAFVTIFVHVASSLLSLFFIVRRNDLPPNGWT